MAARRRRGRTGAADHLKAWQWKPGQSGNPNGRPPRASLKALINQVLDEEIDPQTEPGVTKMNVLARIIVHEMLKPTRGGHAERRLYMEREWPVLRHHRIDRELPYPDLSRLTDAELRTAVKILRKAKAANEGGDGLGVNGSLLETGALRGGAHESAPRQAVSVATLSELLDSTHDFPISGGTYSVDL